MAETKRKRIDNGGKRKPIQSSSGNNKKRRKNKKDEKHSGPRLPNQLRKQIEFLNQNSEPVHSDEDDEEIDSDEEVGGLHINDDLYEYEEVIPEEESKKNRRFDPVDNLEYELPEGFKDENIGSDDDEEDDGEDNDGSRGNEDSELSGGEEDGKHSRLLQRITGMPSEAFDVKKNLTVSEAYPESEFNPSRDALDGSGKIGMADLMGPLRGTAGYNKLNKRISQVEKKSMAILTPLAKVDQEKIERMNAYKITRKEVTKWEPLVKRNREAPTVFFGEQTDVGFATVGAIASEFTPRTEFEKKMASIVQDDEVVDAHMKDGARLLELNMISVEDVKDRQNHLAKMRSLLFRHEMKSKHIKKIKSKTYHRLKNKDKLKTTFSDEQLDPDSAKELAFKQELKRAEERMTLKHKNSSKWAKRAIRRGLANQDEGTRAAISNQLNQHAILTRKMKSMNDSSSSDDSSDFDDDDDLEAVANNDEPLKLVNKAKEKTLKILEDEDEAPKSGVLDLPFMVRGNERRKKAVDEEARLALKEYDSSLRELEENSDEAERSKKATSSGRRVFGSAAKNQSDEMSRKIKSNRVDRDRNSDSEDEFATEDFGDAVSSRNMVVSQKNVHIDPSGAVSGRSNPGQEPVFKRFDDIVGEPGPKTTYDVAIFASNSFKKMKSENKKSSTNKKNSKAVDPALPLKETKEEDEDSGSESGEEMVDGILTSGTKPEYKLPSQADLIRNAFAGDDVEEEFEKEKLETLNEENPEPEKPTLVPGWGQWTHIQKKKGLPSWMVEEHVIAQKKREDALKERKDSHLKHVIISERLDKKAEKLHTATVPYPYTSQEQYERTLRVPLGPDFNPATKVGALIRPDVVKEPGVIIKPIEYEEVDPHGKSEEHKGKGKTQPKKNKPDKGKSVRKTKKLKTKTLQ
ncbi:U3 small nucleolar RNA-associated protein 14 homolog A-like isoform X2 [Papaver somniferum]|uniref:U3 small nucleolar RNA-associated protein 14 homolog A-like isoform X2 n=1 Tax=Papaver somniferum TaxID=3469 RepID=UPI000E701CD7|nr:U3 small nucleolar RNA-associated protein 14 homolog A-like isoform X2 [Papaver somniferum]